MDIALQSQWLTENSVLYALLTDTLTSLKWQEEEFARHGKLTKNSHIQATSQRNDVQPSCDKMELHDS